MVTGLALLVLFQASPGQALDFDLSELVPERLGVSVPGRLSFTPFLSEQVTYETNVFQAPDRPKDDIILRTTPGFLAEFRNSREKDPPVSISAGYRMELLRFLTLDKQDTSHHFAGGQIRRKWPDVVVSVREDFASTTDPPGSELTGRIKSTTNTLGADGEYRLPSGKSLSVGANASWTHVNFEDVQQLNRDERLVGGGVFWHPDFLTKGSGGDVFASYNYGQKSFEDSSRDVTRQVVSVGMRGSLTARLSSTGRFGYEVRESEHPGLKGYHGLVAGGTWLYVPILPTDEGEPVPVVLSLTTDRKVEESVFGTARYFVSSSAALQAERRISSKLAGRVRFSLSDNLYPTKQTVEERTKWRDDTLIGYGASVDYTIQLKTVGAVGGRLRISADYSHTKRDSNFKSFGFDDDKVSVTATLEF